MDPHPVFAPLLALVWLPLCWWSWRTVRRRAAGRFPLMERFGFTPFGGTVWLVMAIKEGLHQVPGLAAAMGSGEFWGMFLVTLVVAFPPCLWADYAFNAILWGVLRPGDGGPPGRPRP